ncbi:hypothetical protein O6H91_05G121200 [Diphasiastrum complanatum]|uniref:Uncharacterized protein n=1 Tax=Diphasiastrum complanatum TaxID=34168 RepID=A0ACC2DSL5_DIPCM|nr:hypothetical protein O6H91_05G121200 [Diphasiastrum complanatum]
MDKCSVTAFNAFLHLVCKSLLLEDDKKFKTSFSNSQGMHRAMPSKDHALALLLRYACSFVRASNKGWMWFEEMIIIDKVHVYIINQHSMMQAPHFQTCMLDPVASQLQPLGHMHFQCPHYCYNDCTLRNKTTIYALDVKELLCAYICSKSSFSDHKSFTPNQLQCNLVSDN